MERKKTFPLMASTLEDVFSLDGKELKKPLNIEDQIRQMIHHGVTFTPQEKSEAYLILQEINYYRLSIFRHLQGEDKSFSRIVKLYDFDEWLRNELMKLTNPIEELVRTKLAYYLSLNYPNESIGLTSIDCPPALCYLDDRIISILKIVHSFFKFKCQKIND